MSGTEVMLWIIMAVMVVISVVVGADIWTSYPGASSVIVHLLGSALVAAVNGCFLWFILIWKKEQA